MSVTGEMLEPQEYLAAASDHADVLAPLFDSGHHALAIYLAGLAVECMFRAFRQKKGLPFTQDHKLSNLGNEAGFPELVQECYRIDFDAAITHLVGAWQNSHRFRSNDVMRRFLKQHNFDRGIKGDYLRENARRLTSSAILLISLGVKQWKL
jgi:hypothetical protein